MIRGHTRGDNRLCMRHLYSNFRKKFPSLDLKNRMWQCAKATHWRDWEKEMKSLRLMSGISCPHAISCINFKGLDLKSYGDDC
ncbi:hypothetical protein Ahy_B02g057171 [Arachis hypogaea]|uniref:Uncharacterized protein n=1 Tax=Arachis hypogaea TaxID=3818 RepID=A0A445AB52_ARAHY|nr:hypothetical protein Ahy_B02g057171 [Arachis hypogaea]